MKENEEPSEALVVQPVELGTLVAYTPQEMVQQASETVSYTHLTLPTILRV